MSESKEIVRNFIEEIIEEDIRNNKHQEGYIPDFLPSPMVICILVMQNLSVLILVWQVHTVERLILGSMIPTL